MDLKYDPHYYPYPSRRSVVYASRGMVCTSHPLAANAGLDIMKAGGNAVDAAVATAAALTVVEPTANGIGSDAFALIWKEGKLYGFNASGPSPAAITMSVAESRGWKDTGKMPRFGWAPVTVPGAPAAWAELASRMGRLSLETDLVPAIDLARRGHAVSVSTSRYWEMGIKRYSSEKGEEFRAWFDTFANGGRAPRPGEVWRSEPHASTLERIGASGARDFYEGAIASRIIDAARSSGGYITGEDLASFSPEWVEPIGVKYRGYDVWEIPPNGQGIAALIALSLLDGFEFSYHDDPACVHLQIEAMKAAFADAHRYVADPRFAEVPVKELLSRAYADSRRADIGDRAADWRAGDPKPGGTVYLCTADAEGTMVSYIQSNYMGFGSGVVIPGTGIALNNRGHCFSLEDGYPNVLAPGKRPYNTIIPGFLTKEGVPVGPFGVMGGFMQPQGHVQVVMNTLDFAMNPQQALDAPRWQWTGGVDVSVECSFNQDLAHSLARRGHSMKYEMEPGGFGRGQVIWRTPYGTLAGATESRTDGCAAAW
ncbi:MAG: gamma-glutamyltransferase family protein [Synergistaceae bacterium]|nr:gamma-glutamyltransferase family protein [Synergistota bacterium]NLM71540.1 gamma-glutamyltransferase family protein [Synergistaceae bacterium]